MAAFFPSAFTLAKNIFFVNTNFPPSQSFPAWDPDPTGMLDVVLTLKVGEVSPRPVVRDKGFFVFSLDGYKREPVRKRVM